MAPTARHLDVDRGAMRICRRSRTGMEAASVAMAPHE